MTCCPPWDPPWWYQYRFFIGPAIFMLLTLPVVYRSRDALEGMALLVIVAVAIAVEKVMSASGGELDS